MGLLSFLDQQPKSLLGLDITSSAVKLLEISRNGNRYKVESYMVRPLPPNTVVEKNINDVEALAEIIRKVVNQAKAKARDTAVAVSGSSVITKVIEMPADLNDQAMETQIALEADQYIPYPLDEVALDFEVIGLSDNNPEQVDVLLAACRRENVDSRADALEQAGLNPKVVDVEVFAVERAFELLSTQLEELGDQVVAIADTECSGKRQNSVHAGAVIWWQAGYRRNPASLRSVSRRGRSSQKTGRPSGRLRIRSAGAI